MKVKEPPNNNNEIKPDELDNRSNMDKNTEYMHLVTSTEVMEPVYNNEKTQDNLDNSSNLDNNTDSMPEITLEKEKEPANISNAKNNSNTDNDINTVLEATSAEAVKPLNYNNNEKTQYNLDNIPNDEIKTIPEVIITKVIEPTNNITEKPIVNSNNHIDIYDMMDMETTIEVTKIEILEPPYDEDALVEDTSMKVAEPSDIIKETNMKNDSKETQGNSDNSSNVILEHMRSLKVVLERTKYYGCSNCNLVFFRPRDVKLHAVKHLLPTTKSDDENRFVKRFKCDECGLRFVQLSTLEAHAAVHAPFPHRCHCGIGYYLQKDLNSHKNLVHIAEIRDQFSSLTDRQQKAFKHEIWDPNIAFALVTERKKEPKSGPMPRLKAELKKRSKSKTGRKKPAVERYRCEEEKLIVQNDDKTFTCPVCFKIYKSKAGVQVHLATHAEVKPYACNLCDKRFTQTGALKLHKKRHTGVKEFRCVFCGKDFFSEHNMRNHMRTHTGEKPFKCSFCPKAFSDQSAHARHERTHTGVKPYTCSFCGMKFSDASGLIAHRRRHDGTKEVKCTVCPKMFWTKDTLRRHMKSVHSYEKDYECKMCNKSFAVKSYLYVHMKSHGELKRFECDYCHFQCRTKNALINHIRSIHLDIKNEMCEDCGMRFTTKVCLQKHHAIVHSRLLNYECDICGERQSVKSLIGKHILQMHSEVRCKTCLKPFVNSADLAEHAAQGCIRCECGKYFTSHALLRVHKVVHQENRPHLCNYCDKRFKTKCRLRKHYVTVHENTKKYECNECGEKFSIRSRLQTHIYLLHSTMLYCHICKKPFVSESALKAHKAKGKCLTEHMCDVCGKVFLSNNKLTSHMVFHDVPKYHCDHCPSKSKTKRILQRHIKLCHKHVYFTKSSRSKARN